MFRAPDSCTDVEDDISPDGHCKVGSLKTMKLGQHMLLNLSWDGKIMFDDEVAMDRFHKYVSRKKV